MIIKISEMKKQIELFLNKGHGGWRSNAGRKRQDTSLQLHIARENFDPKHPIHVNIKVQKDIPNLRTKNHFKLVKRAILTARKKGLRIVHFCVQKNHLHLLIESDSKKSLATGMQSFCTSLARSLNHALKRKGRVFVDRYHPHILKTLKEVKNSLHYIYNNFAKHSKTPHAFDPYSSFICFGDKHRPGFSKIDTYSQFRSHAARDDYKTKMQELVNEAKTWHLNVGWKKVPDS